MIDLHSHVLPGIDDGPETIEGSLALGRAAAAAGTRTIVATPHVSWRYRNSPEVIAEGLANVQRRFAEEDVDLELRGGAELAMTRVGAVAPEELRRLSLNGGPWLLVEPPFTPVASNVEATVAELQLAGHRVLLAHPERCPIFHRHPEMLESLVREGALTSLTAGSLVGEFGETVRRFALELVRRELVHNVASDTHDERGRPPTIAPQLRQAGLGPLEHWLTQAVPAAILEGSQAMPARPQVELPDLPTGRRPKWLRKRRTRS